MSMTGSAGREQAVPSQRVQQCRAVPAPARTGQQASAVSAPVSRLHTVRDCTVVTAAAVAFLLAGAYFLDPSRLHISANHSSLNDQVGYISVARNLAEAGSLRSNVIYPATLSQNKSRNYLYMPGYYVVLAASYVLFGFGVYQSLLPNLSAFVCSAVLAFLLASKLYGRGAGFVAALLFMTLPANVMFSLTAMSELVVAASALAAVAALVFVPQRWRPYGGALLLSMAFMFRETAIFLVMPLVALVVRPCGVWRLRPAMLLAGCTLLGVIAVSQLDICAGRPRLNALEYDDAFTGAKYTDATISPLPPTLSQLRGAIEYNVRRNWSRLIAVTRSLSQLEGLAFDAILVLTLATLAYGGMVRTRDLFPLATGLMTLAALLAVLLIYTPDGYRGLRVLLFTYPLLAVCSAGLVTQVDPARWFPRYKLAIRSAEVALLGLWLWVGLTSVAAVGRTFPASDAEDDATRAFMSSVQHDDRRMLVGPFEVSLPYAFDHHPLQWAFVPMNGQTLDLLSKQYDIGTLLLPLPRGVGVTVLRFGNTSGPGIPEFVGVDPEFAQTNPVGWLWLTRFVGHVGNRENRRLRLGDNELRLEDLKRVGLRFDRLLKYGRQPYAVFKRP
jgi:hypothetical protein